MYICHSTFINRTTWCNCSALLLVLRNTVHPSAHAVCVAFLFHALRPLHCNR